MKYVESVRLLGVLGYLDALTRQLNTAQRLAETPEEQEIVTALKEVVRYTDKNALMYDQGAVLEKHLSQEEIIGLGKLFKENPLLKKFIGLRDIIEDDITETVTDHAKTALRRMGVTSDRVDRLLPTKKSQTPYDVQ